jgi:site-specific DNA-methyltransferase (adenine-specific)
MSVVFEDELTTIIHGKWQDHIDVIDGADVLITDPPDGMSYVSNFALAGPSAPVAGDKDTVERDDLLDNWFGRPRDRGGKLDRPALVFGTWRVPKPTWPIRQLLIWHKGDRPGMGDLSLPWGPSHEDIYVMGGIGEGHWTGKRGPSVIRARVREGNATNSHSKHGHPTPKPILLMQDLVAHTVGDVIVDPFAGSGSTLVAARLLGRRAVGIEMEKRYVDGMVARIEAIPAATGQVKS